MFGRDGGKGACSGKVMREHVGPDKKRGAKIFVGLRRAEEFHEVRVGIFHGSKSICGEAARRRERIERMRSRSAVGFSLVRLSEPRRLYFRASVGLSLRHRRESSAATVRVCPGCAAFHLRIEFSSRRRRFWRFNLRCVTSSNPFVFGAKMTPFLLEQGAFLMSSRKLFMSYWLRVVFAARESTKWNND